MTTPPISTSDEALNSSSESFEIINKSNESLYSVSSETYLSLPEEVLALSSLEEIEDAIENYKKLVLSKTDDSEERKYLVRRIIELRVRLENLKEHSKEADDGNKPKEIDKVILGHHFTYQNVSISDMNFYCDSCSNIICNIVDNWYLCSDCNYACHEKCLNCICRVCAHVIVSEKPNYVLDICPEPENGLGSQNYRCAECLTQIYFRGKNTISRLCDYTGKYYCSSCHWNSKSVIPARVIHNWDFSKRNVCRQSKQILQLMLKLPILNLQELNPTLFACVEELATVKELRQQLMQMKKYLTSCKSAVKEHLLWQLGDKVHFFESEDNYSLQDLIELHSGELISYIENIKGDFTRHIRVKCETCKGRGFFCELCTDEKVIFPFEKNVISCSKCHSTFHLSCWMKNNQNCPKCVRIRQRLEKEQTDSLINGVDS